MFAHPNLLWKLLQSTSVDITNCHGPEQKQEAALNAHIRWENVPKYSPADGYIQSQYGESNWPDRLIVIADHVVFKDQDRGIKHLWDFC